MEEEQKKTAITELKRPEIFFDIGRLISVGNSYTEVADKINQKYGLRANNEQIREVYNTYVTRRKEMIDADKEIQEGLRKDLLNTREQLLASNKKVWEIIDKTKYDDTKIKALKEVREQLVFQERLIHKLMEGFRPEKADTIMLTQVVVNSLDQLEKDGFIKILKPVNQPIDIKIEEVEENGGNTDKEDSDAEWRHGDSGFDSEGDNDERGIQ